jgi:outer membrane autotransporter protein
MATVSGAIMATKATATAYEGREGFVIEIQDASSGQSCSVVAGDPTITSSAPLCDPASSSMPFETADEFITTQFEIAGGILAIGEQGDQTQITTVPSHDAELLAGVASLLPVMTSLPFSRDIIGQTYGTTGGWARLIAGGGDRNVAFSNTARDIDYSYSGALVGVDSPIGASTTGGLLLMFGSIDLEPSVGGDVSGDVLGVGAHFVHRFGDAAYLSGHLIGVSHDLDIAGGTAGGGITLAATTDGQGFGGGLEFGWRTPVGEEVGLELRSRFLFADVSVDDLIEPVASRRVSLEDAGTSSLSIGGRLNRETDWGRGFVSLDFEVDLQGGPEVAVGGAGGARFKASRPDSTVLLGFGLDYVVGDNGQVIAARADYSFEEGGGNGYNGRLTYEWPF